MKHFGLVLIIMVIFSLLTYVIVSDREPTEEPLQSQRTYSYGVSAAHPLAVKVGMEVLEQGGNAVDAAIAVSYALAVVEPYGSGLGGGGAMLVYDPRRQQSVVYDYFAAQPLSSSNHTAGIGIPGFVRGMETIHSDLGTVPMEKLIEPAYKLAQNGYDTSEALTYRLKTARYKIKYKALPHLYPQNTPLPPKQRLVQSQLAQTLKLIQKYGADGFYSGTIADAVTKAADFNAKDLSSYKVYKRNPIKGRFGGYQIYSAGPPFGGITLVQLLQTSELLNTQKLAMNSPAYIEIMGKILDSSYSIRSRYIGDPNYIKMNTKALTSQDLSRKMAAAIISGTNPKQLTDEASEEYGDHENTTHFVIIDKEGRVVSTTNTLSSFFGSGKYVHGFFLNNQLINFSSRKTSPNAAAPGKRPRSFIAPTILVSKNETIGIGSPGGKKIPLMLCLVLNRVIKLGEPIETATKQPRFFIQGQKVFFEKEVSAKTKKTLREKGYSVIIHDYPMYYGGVQSLVRQADGTIRGGADYRRGAVWMASR